MSESVSLLPEATIDVPSNEPAIELRGLRKVFRDQVAVDNLTLSVDYGEVFGFLGPNGAGKTTSIKMLMGLVYPTSGQARLLGRKLGDRWARRQIGY
jgi:ABC-2 type transport system ATP-binding protein